MPPPGDGAGEDERQEMSNAGARADTIRAAVDWLAEREAEIKSLRAEISEYKAKHIKGDLGFKLADWAAVYRVSQLDVEDRDKLLDTIREGFEALGIGGSVDWVTAAAQTAAAPSRRPAAAGNGQVAEKHDLAWETGFADGLAGNVDHAARWPAGEFGHVDYVLGNDEGRKRNERDPALAP